ncbi:MAG: hypothetical protein KGO02_24595 [Alphaproteobacteria bacterium]|nr:hypothetical protein [Alphaproteobacteria bacterium]
MPPLLAQLSVRHREVHMRLWLPLFLLWLLVLPVGLIVLPFAIVGLAMAGIRPVRTLAAILGVLSALSGTMIDVERANSAVLIRFL